jgi:hypothetical protein
MLYVVDVIPAPMQEAASGLGTEKFTGGWNGFAPTTSGEGDPIVVARVLGTWDSLAGGDATSKITLDAYTGKSDTEIAKKFGPLMISDGVSIGTSKDFCVDDEADGSKYLWICAPAAAGSGGIHLPMGARTKGRIINGGTAYTAGNFIINEIVIYGFKPIFLTDS